MYHSCVIYHSCEIHRISTEDTPFILSFLVIMDKVSTLWAIHKLWMCGNLSPWDRVRKKLLASCQGLWWLLPFPSLENLKCQGLVAQFLSKHNFLLRPHISQTTPLLQIPAAAFYFIIPHLFPQRHCLKITVNDTVSENLGWRSVSHMPFHTRKLQMPRKLLFWFGLIACTVLTYLSYLHRKPQSISFWLQ